MERREMTSLIRPLPVCLRDTATMAEPLYAILQNISKQGCEAQVCALDAHVERIYIYKIRN